MMRIQTIAVSALAGFLAAGCATTIGGRQSEKEAMETQVSSLETQVMQLAQRLEELARGQETLTEEVQTLKTTQPRSSTNIQPTSKVTLSVRQTQQALANAGFYKGAIDGREGPRTKQAIIDFQKSQGLTPDGKVGAKTSAALSKYLKASKE
jgi:peptidoglycan hydrolase-like protein with peptidoglycan-binding domain